ncbi:hypothetical protein [Streptomyces sp. enrichment culture]
MARGDGYSYRDESSGMASVRMIMVATMARGLPTPALRSLSCSEPGGAR